MRLRDARESKVKELISSMLFNLNVGLNVLLSAVVMALGWITIYFLGTKNKFLSQVEPYYKVVMWNKDPRHFFGSVPGKNVNWKTGIVTDGKQRRSLLWVCFGVVSIGLPPYGKIYTWEITIKKWVVEPDGSEKLVVIKRMVDKLHPRPSFAFIVIDAETIDKFRLTIKGKVTYKIIDVKTALFLTDSWTKNAEAALVAGIGDFIKVRTFSEALSQPIEISNADLGAALTANAGFIKAIKTLNEDTAEGNKSIRRYGVEIDDLNVTSIEISGADRDRLASAASAESVADLEGKGAIKKSLAKLEVAKNEALGIEATIKGLGEQANQFGLLKLARAIEKHNGPLAIGAGIMSTMDMKDGEEK